MQAFNKTIFACKLSYSSVKSLEGSYLFFQYESILKISVLIVCSVLKNESKM